MDIDSTAVACSLAPTDRKSRLAWINELNAAALRDHRRDASRIELAYDPSAAPRVRELVDREKECCPFLSFTIREENGACILVIETPGDTGTDADELFAAYVDRGSIGGP